jgi:hypothetical protein
MLALFARRATFVSSGGDPTAMPQQVGQCAFAVRMVQWFAQDPY